MGQELLKKNRNDQPKEDAARTARESGEELTNETLEAVTGGLRLITRPEETSE